MPWLGGQPTTRGTKPRMPWQPTKMFAIHLGRRRLPSAVRCADCRLPSRRPSCLREDEPFSGLDAPAAPAHQGRQGGPPYFGAQSIPSPGDFAHSHGIRLVPSQNPAIEPAMPQPWAQALERTARTRAHRDNLGVGENRPWCAARIRQGVPGEALAHGTLPHSGTLSLDWRLCRAAFAQRHYHQAASRHIVNRGFQRVHAPLKFFLPRGDVPAKGINGCSLHLNCRRQRSDGSLKRCPLRPHRRLDPGHAGLQGRNLAGEVVARRLWRTRGFGEIRPGRRLWRLGRFRRRFLGTQG